MTEAGPYSGSGLSILDRDLPTIGPAKPHSGSYQSDPYALPAFYTGSNNQEFVAPHPAFTIPLLIDLFRGKSVEKAIEIIEELAKQNKIGAATGQAMADFVEALDTAEKVARGKGGKLGQLTALIELLKRQIEKSDQQSEEIRRAKELVTELERKKKRLEDDKPSSEEEDATGGNGSAGSAGGNGENLVNIHEI